MTTASTPTTTDYEYDPDNDNTKYDKKSIDTRTRSGGTKYNSNSGKRLPPATIDCMYVQQ